LRLFERRKQGKRGVGRTVAFALHSGAVHRAWPAVLLPLGGVQTREDDGNLGLPREGNRGRDVPRSAVGAAHLDAGHASDHLQLRPPLEPEQRRLREHEVVPSVIVGQDVGAGVEVRADRRDLELARRAARFERQQPFILQQYKTCTRPRSRSGVAGRAACKRAVSLPCIAACFASRRFSTSSISASPSPAHSAGTSSSASPSVMSCVMVRFSARSMSACSSLPAARS